VICKKCQIAGDLIAETRGTSDFYIPLLGHEAPVSFRQMIDAVAQRFHKQCKESTHCDCQHKIDWEGKVIKGGKEAGQPSG
jgi:hypothetical protein